MRDIEKLTIEYIGYKVPNTVDEVDMEILGLKTAICAIEQRIATLRQSVQLEKMVSKSQGEKVNAENIEQTKPNT